MNPPSTPSLEIPSFFHGGYASLLRLTRQEGQRCAEQYRKDGTLPFPRELLVVPPGEQIILRGVVDFERERPAWRLYVLGDMITALCKELAWRDAFKVSDMYETLAHETPWGALYFATGRGAPYDAGSYARRIKAVLRFWSPLESARYLFNSFSASLSLSELLMESCGWAPRAWCPGEGGALQSQLQKAADLMERATKEDCIEVILRQVPHVLPLARKLKHPEALADPRLWRERLAKLVPEEFNRVSSALPASMLDCVYDWDKQLGLP